MCGIVGYLSATLNASDRLIDAMAARLTHRGPDGLGTWTDPEAGIALGHRRLAIVDPSQAGRQPMISADENLVLIYNGEIYNHRRLRAEVEVAGWDEPWHGHSDTETLLAALQSWGLPETLRRLNGMFAFAVWNRKRRILSLARDRVGEKPLYYGRVGRTFLFGSELKALGVHPEWRGDIDRNAITLLLRHGYIPDPFSIYSDICKLEPAHYVEVSLDQHELQTPRSYWSLREVVGAERRPDPEAELLDELHHELLRSVAMRMEADVPLGAFLSGGIDSSTIVALMQAQSAKPVRTFTIGFDVPGYNEAENAKAIAARLGTDHSELYVTPRDALDVVPALPELWDEPFADSSQIPTFLLCRMAREHVTVALSGDGGDEMFGGYNRYGRGYELHRRLSRLPPTVRSAVAMILQWLPSQKIDQWIGVLPRRLRYPGLDTHLQKLAGVMQDAEGEMFYRRLVSLFPEPEDFVIDGQGPTTLLNRNDEWPDLADFRETMMYLDTLTFLPGDILAKVDRASMAVSLEARAPFLDHELVEFAWTLPMEMKLQHGRSKWALRQILERYVPRSMIDRPKMGFGIPLEYWLEGPLRGWVEALLDENRLKAEGYFNPTAVRTLWETHLRGQRKHYQLWAILMFQAWLQSALAPGRQQFAR